jgi:hypothetical protein
MKRTVTLTQESLDNHFDGDEDRVVKACEDFNSWCEDEELEVEVTGFDFEFRSQASLARVLLEASRLEDEGLGDDCEVIIALLGEKVRGEDDYGDEDGGYEDEDEDDLDRLSPVKWFSWMNKARAPPAGVYRDPERPETRGV